MINVDLGSCSWLHKGQSIHHWQMASLLLQEVKDFFVLLEELQVLADLIWLLTTRSYVDPNPSQRAIFFLKRFEDGSSYISEG